MRCSTEVESNGGGNCFPPPITRLSQDLVLDKPSRNVNIYKLEGTTRNRFLAIIALILVSCSQVENVSPTPSKPNPTNALTSPTKVPALTAVSSPSLPGTGWKTFGSVNLQIAVDYPPDWLVGEGASGVTFTSPSGLVIQLTKIETDGLSPEEFLRENQLPNTRCSTNVNGYDIKVLICFDTISGGYNADFIIILPQGTTKLLSMTMPRKGDVQDFDKMVGSVRPRANPP